MPAVDRVEPANETVRLGNVAEGEKSLERERRVPEPGVAIVPVALAADSFGKGGRRGGRYGSRGAEREQFQRQQRTVDRLAVLVREAALVPETAV